MRGGKMLVKIRKREGKHIRNLRTLRNADPYLLARYEAKALAVCCRDEYVSACGDILGGGWSLHKRLTFASYIS